MTSPAQVPDRPADPAEMVAGFNASRWVGAPVRYWPKPDRATKGTTSQTSSEARLDAYGVPVVDVISRSKPVPLALLETLPAFQCTSCATRPVITADTWPAAEARYADHWTDHHGLSRAERIAELRDRWRAEWRALAPRLSGWIIWHDDPNPPDEVRPPAAWRAVRAPAGSPVEKARRLPGQVTDLDARGLYEACRAADQRTARRAS
jgi:hypothetical protein